MMRHAVVIAPAVVVVVVVVVVVGTITVMEDTMLYRMNLVCYNKEPCCGGCFQQDLVRRSNKNAD
jgi:type IV secretory pathway VirB3-like protein